MNSKSMASDLTQDANFSSTTHYDVLQVEANSSIEDIRKAYKSAALRFHPDKHDGGLLKDKAQDIFTKITDAWETLRDEKKREEYDRCLNAEDDLPIAYEVRLAEMDEDEISAEEGEEIDRSTSKETSQSILPTMVYTYPCRCGQTFEARKEEKGMDALSTAVSAVR
eukprot:CAMPEP_0184489772 /NCGR_PEP_ID=MMETSP0113_2-20130426/16344_1 /TAXON_ID=91329 /ORGANISM="Norrisiella sphaerica, Strain BC52" /LENGTH=166 /DNA_ID=CAMNT_0026873375 /DNA_START=65 /DNA_END=566 /DNA_ORIENTATION=-